MQKTKMKKRCRDGVTCVVLCTLPSIYLVCVFFGTAIPTSLYIFGKCFSYFIFSNRFDIARKHINDLCEKDIYKYEKHFFKLVIVL